MISVFFSFIFSFILSCLVLSYLLCLLSLSLSPCDVVCCVVCEVCGVCVVCGMCRVTRLNAHNVVSLPVLLTKKSPRRALTWPHRFTKETFGFYNFSLRIGREQHVPDSSNLSLYLTKLLSSSFPGETLEGTSREMVRFVFRSLEKSFTNDLRVSIS